ncbi:hypothetical protein BDQ12DRAFT_715559 [Crucibulum laeve]|uniref:Uncharacterized protein n=1 Tax=Crucibulum laeve TaxID=68775 RepID=A0A5C3LMF4_9AGAR|nr:hypothetical protein BDQ12DRAFT_715559 [Crucibulum laeve]
MHQQRQMETLEPQWWCHSGVVVVVDDPLTGGRSVSDTVIETSTEVGVSDTLVIVAVPSVVSDDEAEEVGVTSELVTVSEVAELLGLLVTVSEVAVSVSVSDAVEVIVSEVGVGVVEVGVAEVGVCGEEESSALVSRVDDGDCNKVEIGEDVKDNKVDVNVVSDVKEVVDNAEVSGEGEEEGGGTGGGSEEVGVSGGGGGILADDWGVDTVVDDSDDVVLGGTDGVGLDVAGGAELDALDGDEATSAGWSEDTAGLVGAEILLGVTDVIADCGRVVEFVAAGVVSSSPLDVEGEDDAEGDDAGGESEGVNVDGVSEKSDDKKVEMMNDVGVDGDSVSVTLGNSVIGKSNHEARIDPEDRGVMENGAEVPTFVVAKKPTDWEETAGQEEVDGGVGGINEIEGESKPEDEGDKDSELETDGNEPVKIEDKLDVIKDGESKKEVMETGEEVGGGGNDEGGDMVESEGGGSEGKEDEEEMMGKVGGIGIEVDETLASMLDSEKEEIISEKLASVEEF